MGPHKSSKEESDVLRSLLVQTFSRPDVLPVTQPTVTEHWRNPSSIRQGSSGSTSKDAKATEV